MTQHTSSANIQWDYGTAFEFFISLHVLHVPDYFGIRPSYAAGVRSRIPAVERKLLEDVLPFIGVPLKWIHELPAPKDAISALWALKQTPAAERISTIICLDEEPHESAPEKLEKYKRVSDILKLAKETGQWEPEDAELLARIYSQKMIELKPEDAGRFLALWSRPEELGDGFLAALQAYYQAFFEEEEKRVAPILRAGLEQAQSIAPGLSIDELFYKLSQGIQLSDEFRASRIIIAPAFWTTPLIFFEKFDPDTLFLAFGTRPANMSVVPGESLPDGLVRSLKALADPTRLKILFYLSHESLSPSELARRLHLRAPTVTHHLSELRLASLVNLIVDGQERKYTARREALQTTFESLQNFLDTSNE